MNDIPTTKIPSGWMCPKCGAVMAYFQHYCVFCRPITSANVTNIEQSNPTIKERELKEGK